MQFKNQKLWREIRETQQAGGDPYNIAAVNYAERWATLAEAEMTKGTPFDQAVKATAEQTGISIAGGQYNYVKVMLRDCWAHGNQFAKLYGLEKEPQVALKRGGATAKRTPAERGKAAKAELEDRKAKAAEKGRGRGRC